MPLIAYGLSKNLTRKLKELVRDVEYRQEDGVHLVREGDFEWYMPQKDILKVDFCKNFLEKYDRYVDQLRPGDTVLKIGAATGEDTVPMARQVGDEGHVFAVEPNRPISVVCRRTSRRRG